ncbi:50S ribosomal protein L30 [Actinomycetota bacterium]|nr:50S ribosomal protein L30 [Actinomycetota bacterium]
MAKITIKQVKSTIGRKDNQIDTVRSLGLKRIGHEVEQEDNAVIRGMINTVSHLVEFKGE